MTGTVRWLHSPDGSALLVVEDWNSAENEPFYDGFLLASEITGRTVQVDSVWDVAPSPDRSEEHTSELQSLMRISYAVFCLKHKNPTDPKERRTQYITPR